ncbi:hypothetical protein HDU96_007775 [Phlyctochytrium bullatum]|nr:hypothetical protein HDU96_007775 [Phlyctochytrium bullatum]
MAASALLTLLALWLPAAWASLVVVNPAVPASNAANVILQQFKYNVTSGALSGSIWVNNLAYTKVVKVYYSNTLGSGWNNAYAIDASYTSSSSNNREIWSFSGANQGLIGPGTLFYLKYTVSNTNYYDNNSNTNFKIPADGNTYSVAVNPANPASNGGNVVVSSYAFDGASSAFSTKLWIKNLAYTKVVSVTVRSAAGVSVGLPASYSGAASNGYEVWTASGALNAFGEGSTRAGFWRVRAAPDVHVVDHYLDLDHFDFDVHLDLDLNVDFHLDVDLDLDFYLDLHVDFDLHLNVDLDFYLHLEHVDLDFDFNVDFDLDLDLDDLHDDHHSSSSSSSSTSTTTTTTSTSSSFAPPTATFPVRVHPENPTNNVPVLLESYWYDVPTRQLGGGAWVRNAVGGSSGTLEVIGSDTSGLFTAGSTTSIQATYTGPSSVAGYDYWTFRGVVNAAGGQGMHFYLKYTAPSGTASYDNNGSPTFNYRVDRDRYVPAGWKGRAVYQVLTDRFARTSGSLDRCTTAGTVINEPYCGGTWKGLTNKLDYIQNMGFDAVWISSVVRNTPFGYHGYWPRDPYATNDEFGTPDDLRALIKAAHDRKMYVMIDTVPNHVGPNIAQSQFPYPLNQDWAYHTRCDINYNTATQDQMEKCRLNPVNPDLNTENVDIQNYLYGSAEWLSKFGADGYRLDAARHVPVSFWQQYVPRLNTTFTMGEVAHTPYVGAYQGYMTSLQAFPTYYGIITNVFVNKNSMKSIDDQHYYNGQAFTDVSVLGNFIDHQDVPRFLKLQPDQALFRNALAYVLFADGLPNIYQGTEQAFADVGEYRRPLWDSGYSTLPAAGTYQWLSIMVKARRDIGRETFTFSAPEKIAPASPTNIYVFRRKPFIVALTNSGSNVATSIQIPATWGDNRVLRNVLIPTDTLTPTNGVYTINLLGEPKIYV